MNTGKIYVWTKKGQPINLPTLKHPSKLHIWGGISVMGKTNLKIFTVKFNQEQYKTVLNECLIHETNALYGNQWVLQEDQSYPHWKGGKGLETGICPPPDRLAVQ